MNLIVLSKKYVHLLVILIQLIFYNASVDSANIVFLFEGGNLSHKINIWPFVLGLAKAGHNVTFISSSDKKMEEHANIKDIAPEGFIHFTKSLFDQDRIQARKDGTKWDVVGTNYQIICEDSCNVLFNVYKNDPQFYNVFNEDKVDLLIINSVFNECVFYLAHAHQLQFIVYSSSTVLPWFYQAYGLPFESSRIPDIIPSTAYPPGILDRLKTFYRFVKGYSRPTYTQNKLESIYRESFRIESSKMLPSILELERNASLVFLNTHYTTDFPRSLPPFVISIGGMQCWEPIKDLPSDFKHFMDDSDGVILISFGSTIDLAQIDQFYKNIFFNMMKKYEEIRFIVKFDEPILESFPPNVMVSKWLPQREILSHPKMLGFMTHGGLNSVNEATCHGVPLIVIPLFADQDFNALRIEAQGLGLIVEITQLTQAILNEAVGKILYDQMYKKNMDIRSKLFKDRLRTPVDEAVLWTEFVLRQNDTSAMKPMLIDQSWLIVNMVDVILIYFIIFSIPPLLIFYIIRLFVHSVTKAVSK